MAESGSIDSDKVKVAIRVRPFNRREIDLKTKCVVEVKGDQTVLHYVPPTTSSSVTNNGSTAHNNSATTATPTPTGKGGTFTPAKDKDSKDVSATAQNGTYRPPKVGVFLVFFLISSFVDISALMPGRRLSTLTYCSISGEGVHGWAHQWQSFVFLPA
ncbi:Kinesin-like protein kif13b [Tyrophagus putrescentiae]|nr:Kinesin-like protein kif13b [Tyrophagus putrescentiae]